MEEEIKKYLDEKGIEYEVSHPEFSNIERPGSDVIYLMEQKTAIFVGFGDIILKEILPLEDWTHITITDKEEIDIKLGEL